MDREGLGDPAEQDQLTGTVRELVPGEEGAGVTAVVGGRVPEDHRDPDVLAGHVPASGEIHELRRPTPRRVGLAGRGPVRGRRGGVRMSAWTVPSSSRTATRVGVPRRATSSLSVLWTSLLAIGVAVSLSPFTVAINVLALTASRTIRGRTGGTARCC